MKNKNELRKWAKEKRKSLDIDNISIELVKLLKNTEEYKQAKNIMIFYPLKNEINLLSLLDDKTKNFYLPKINGKSLLCCHYKKNIKLCESYFGTQEPDTKPTPKTTIDLVIIPALCCDVKNYRLGYGKGYYDKFLINCNAKKLVCIPKELIINTVFPEEHDIPADLILSY